MSAGPRQAGRRRGAQRGGRAMAPAPDRADPAGAASRRTEAAP
jgi:hypothetical protein